MSKALSVDLRVRVLQAVTEGASHREAAERFGVSAASVSRCCKREQGAPGPKARDGDRRSKTMKCQADAIMAIVAANRDITLAETRAALVERQVAAIVVGLWRFFRRHRIALKKVGARQRARSQLERFSIRWDRIRLRRSSLQLRLV
jgi:transposase